jgi:hypothetical protein
MILHYSQSNEDRLFLVRARQEAQSLRLDGLETVKLTLFDGQRVKRTSKGITFAGSSTADIKAAFATMVHKKATSAPVESSSSSIRESYKMMNNSS